MDLRSVATAIARKLGIPASETFRLHHVGEVRAGLAGVSVVCPHVPGVSCLPVDTDPFAGRTPSAGELERLFADGGRTRHRTLRSAVAEAVVRLEPMEFVSVSKSAHPPSSIRYRPSEVVDRGEIVCGRCPDCGLVLVATTFAAG